MTNDECIYEDDVPRRPGESRFRWWLRRHVVGATLWALALLFLLVFLAPRIFIFIGPGEAGVMYRPLLGGTVVDHVYGEGLWILFPLNRMYVYDLRVQETKRTLDVLTQDGLNVQLELSIRYHPDSATLGLLHEQVGPEYRERVVVPEVLSAVRHQVGNRTVEELYTGQAPELLSAAARAEADTSAPLPQSGLPDPSTAAPVVGRVDSDNVESRPPAENLTLAEVIETALEQVSRTYVVVDDVVLLRATLPKRVEEAIEKKIEHKQAAEAQTYRLQAALAEIELKRREAAANTLLAASLNENLLRYRGIEATKELAQSHNSKIIVFGNNATGLPLVLGGVQ
ncbi:MAG TPA: prohibitin family protein [Thermoanaerobaculia bacterium]|nr:prohibitin family protein [Thermoanaerobaculia bacterium]